MKLFPLSKEKHIKGHNIIDYEDKNYICKKHSEIFIKYCKKCKENMCILCENEHNDHDIIYLGNMIINKDNLIKGNDELKKTIDKLKNNIEQLYIILNKVLNNIEMYYNINEHIIKNYENKKRNYYLLNNLNEIDKYNKSLIKDIDNINNEPDIYKKYKYLIDIMKQEYEKINYVNKTELYENENIYIGDFKNNTRNGKGIMYYNSKDNNNRERYEGEWKNGRKWNNVLD